MTIVNAYLKMWPREVLDLRSGNQLLSEVWTLLHRPGVYVLYRDDRPHYIGRASKKLSSRIHSHANRPKDKYYNFWNYFSAFVVNDPKHIPKVEGILIAAFPTENSAQPRFPKLAIPARVARLIHSQRLITVSPIGTDRNFAKTNIAPDTAR